MSVVSSIVPKEAANFLIQIANKLDEKKDNCDDITKEKVMEALAKEFQLGIPKHKLPKNIKQLDHSLCVDLSYEFEEGEALNMRLKSLSFAYDDNICDFYEVCELKNGDFFAFCSAHVSMPNKDINIFVFIDGLKYIADSYGIECSYHSELSCHFQNKSELILYKPKTPASVKKELFSKSFRKWVIENKEKLLSDNKSPKLLKYVVEDVCKDETFPLNIESYEDLELKHPHYLSRADNGWMNDFKFLMNKWVNR